MTLLKKAMKYLPNTWQLQKHVNFKKLAVKLFHEASLTYHVFNILVYNCLVCWLPHTSNVIDSNVKNASKHFESAGNVLILALIYQSKLLVLLSYVFIQFLPLMVSLFMDIENQFGLWNSGDHDAMYP